MFLDVPATGRFKLPVGDTTTWNKVLVLVPPATELTTVQITTRNDQTGKEEPVKWGGIIAVGFNWQRIGPATAAGPQGNRSDRQGGTFMEISTASGAEALHAGQAAPLHLAVEPPDQYGQLALGRFLQARYGDGRQPTQEYGGVSRLLYAEDAFRQRPSELGCSNWRRLPGHIPTSCNRPWVLPIISRSATATSCGTGWASTRSILGTYKTNPI